MMSPRRLLLACASGVVLLSATAAPTLVLAQSAPTSATQQAAAWPQANSDLPADPAVRFGTLPNGMRYAIMRNATPPRQAALRLRIDAGSLSENDDQKGLAHFLEHMAFNGSTNIPEGEMTKNLERLGLSFGGDTNAFTSFDQTAYTLNLPNTSDEVVDASLFALREVAGELLFNTEAVDRERGVIVGEDRIRDTPSYRATKAMLPFLAPGQRLADRLPIGDLDIIRTAPRDRFVDFYRAYYRPERATVIAVGDFDVDAMEAKIREKFADWTNPAPNGSDPDLGRLQPREAETRIHVEPGTQSTAQIYWTKVHDAAPDSVATRRKDLVRGLALAVLNRRMSEISRSANPPFLGGGAGYQSLFNAVDAATLVVAFNPGGWQRAIETAEQEQRRLVQYGVGQDELDREITEYRTALTASVAGAATRQTTGLAGSLLNTVNDDEVFTAPADDLKLFEAAVTNLTLAEVNAAAAETFAGNGPLAFVTTPVAIEGGEAAVTAAIEASRQVAVTAPAVAAAVEWPYANFGTPGTVTARTEVADLGTTFVTFANGVKLTVKPTTFDDDQILVSVRAGNGTLDLPSDRAVPMWAAGSEVTEGGLGKLTKTQLDRVTASNVVGAGFGADPDAFQFSGGTRPEDLALQMQLLAAYFTDAGWRPEPFDQVKGQIGTQLDQIAATPGGAFGRYGVPMLYSGDKRFGLPTPADIEAAQLSDLRQVITDSIARGPVEVIVIGDVTVEDAIAQTAATFGALPTRPVAMTPSEAAARVRFPAPTAEPVTINHTGAAAQALGYVAWPTLDAIGDRKPSRTVSLLARVLQLRVTDELREKQGVAYSPGASATASTVFPDYGYAFVQAETPPDALPGFFKSVDDVATALRDAPVTEDELNRARLSAVESIRRSQATNGYWLGALENVQDDATQLAAIRTSISDLEAITPADIQKAAQTYLLPDRAWRAQVTAQAAAQ